MTEFFTGFLTLCIYFAICASCAVLLKLFTPIPKEVYRKLLHFILLGSLPVFVYAYHTWWISALSTLLFAAVVYPVLQFAEHFKGYSALLSERSHGEVKHSLLYVFGMFAAVTAVVELYTMHGLDTVTCPLAAMAVLLPLVHLFGGTA